MIKTTVPLGVRLDQMLVWIGASNKRGTQADVVAALCRKLISELGDAEITVQVPDDHILCQACDELRGRGKHEAVAMIEELVQALKGRESRVIAGSMDFTAQNISHLDDQLELLRKVVIAQS
jgi:hypothetical protein